MLGKQSKHVEERRRGKFSNRDLKLRAAAIVAPPLRHAGVPRRIHMSDSPAAPLGLSTYASLLCFHFVVVAWQIDDVFWDKANAMTISIPNEYQRDLQVPAHCHT